MTVIPCGHDPALRTKIEQYAKALETEAHRLGDHGLDAATFYDSGILAGAIEVIRGRRSATMREKRDFLRHVLNHMQDRGFICDWNSAENRDRHDYQVEMASGKIVVIEQKGCLDGNNTTIFKRPPDAEEFILWSLCHNKGSNPRHSIRSGLHSRLSAHIVHEQVVVDGLIVWDVLCGSNCRPCPKLKVMPERAVTLGPFTLPPPCIYVFPSTVPAPRNNPSPRARQVQDVEFLDALHRCFDAGDASLHSVSFETDMKETSVRRRTTVAREGKVVMVTRFDKVRRS